MTDSAKAPGRNRTPADKRSRNATDLEATAENEFRFVELGDVALPQEKTGFDPYNSAHGRPNIDAWKPKRR